MDRGHYSQPCCCTRASGRVGIPGRAVAGKRAGKRRCEMPSQGRRVPAWYPCAAWGASSRTGLNPSQSRLNGWVGASWGAFCHLEAIAVTNAGRLSPDQGWNRRATAPIDTPGAHRECAVVPDVDGKGYSRRNIDLPAPRIGDKLPHAQTRINPYTGAWRLEFPGLHRREGRLWLASRQPFSPLHRSPCPETGINGRGLNGWITAWAR